MELAEDDERFPDIPLVVDSLGKILARVSDTKQYFQDRTPIKVSNGNAGPYKLIGAMDRTPEVMLKAQTVRAENDAQRNALQSQDPFMDEGQRPMRLQPRLEVGNGLRVRALSTNHFYRRLQGAPSGRSVAGPSKISHHVEDLTLEDDEDSSAEDVE